MISKVEEKALKLDRQIARTSLYEFGVMMGWKDEKAAPFHRVLAENLEKVERGEIKRLLIMAPPRHGKTLWVSHYFPAWCIARRLDLNFVASSYSASLAYRNSRAVERICNSPEYKRLFGDVFDGKNTEEERVLAGGGLYRALGVGGPFAGFPANIVTIDDPFKNREEAESETIRQKVDDWYGDDVLTRLEGWPRAVVLMHTRWHEDDLAGRRLNDANAHEWTVLRFPQIQDLEDPPDYDPREVGEPLWPKMLWEPPAPGQEDYPMMTKDEAEATYIAEFEAAMKVNPYGTEALRQQNPIAKGSQLFDDNWKKYTTSSQLALAASASRVYIAVDATFNKSVKKGDRVGIAVVARIGHQYFVLDAFGDRMTYNQMEDAVKTLAEQYPMATVVIEQAANGVILFQNLSQVLPSVADFEPGNTKKEDRVEYLTTIARVGNLIWIHESICPRIVDAIEETWKFGQKKWDDIPDAISQAVLYDRLNSRGESALARVTGTGPGSLRELLASGCLNAFAKRRRRF